MPLTRRISPAVARKLGWYVYLYVNPLDGKVFYVGKGKGGRALAHLDARAKKATAKVIRQIRAVGREPKIEILAHRLPSGEAALRVEAAVIDALSLENLANRVRGWRGTELGRRSIDEALAKYTEKRAVIREPAILIRINDLYRYGMRPVELYDATRSAWVTGPRREKVKYAFAVFEGVVREVYRITGWHRGGTTFNSRYDGRRQRRPGRWEFVGTLAEERIRRRYVDRYVGYLFTRGAQNPITYANVE